MSKKSPLLVLATLGVILGGGMPMMETLAQPAPNTAPVINRPVLRSGSKGSAVAELQAILKLLGFYNGAVDGQYAESTVIAVSNFQQAAGLTVDGVMGVNSWQTLLPSGQAKASTNPVGDGKTPTKPNATSNANPAAAPVSQNPTQPPQANPPAKPKPKPENQPLLKESMEGEAVTLLQQRLKALGFFTGEVDGIFGRNTLMAVFAAQKHFKLDADGIVGYQTWLHLLK